MRDSQEVYLPLVLPVEILSPADPDKIDEVSALELPNHQDELTYFPNFRRSTRATLEPDRDDNTELAMVDTEVTHDDLRSY